MMYACGVSDRGKRRSHAPTLPRGKHYRTAEGDATALDEMMLYAMLLMGSLILAWVAHATLQQRRRKKKRR